MPDSTGRKELRPNIRWPNGARLAVSIAVHYEEGAERSPAFGDPSPEEESEGFQVSGNQRAVHGESFFEYGARRGVWRLLELLDKHQVKATFLCCGAALERNPEVAREISSRGHEPCGHGYRWVPYYGMSRDDQRAEIRKAIRSIERTTGQRPLGWNSRVPNQDTRELLIEEGGFIYDSDSYDDDAPRFLRVGKVDWLTVPYTLEVTDHKFWFVPTMPGFTSPESFFRVMKANFDQLYEEGRHSPRMLSISLRPRIGGRPSRAQQFDRFMHYAKGFPDVWFARRVDIARWWLGDSKDAS